MGTRFGGRAYYRDKLTILYWVVGLLTTITVLLLFALTQSLSSNTHQLTSPVQNAEATVVPSVEVLIAAKDIEPNTQILNPLIKTASIPYSQVTPENLLARDKLSVLGNYATEFLVANQPLFSTHFTAEKPSGPYIPPGFCGATITVNDRNGIGNVQPRDRVDVILSYVDPDDKQKKVVTVSSFLKVLSVMGKDAPHTQGAPQGKPLTVTFLATHDEAKKLKLAQSLGDLSLTLIGEETFEPTLFDPNPIEASDITGKRAPQKQPCSGSFSTVNPLTGEVVKRKFCQEEGWVNDPAETVPQAKFEL